MSKINSLPSGLQEFLGNTSQGVNPSELSNVVTPTFDISDFWKVPKTKVIRIAINFTAVYTNGSFTVPNNEIWMLVSVSGNVNILTTESAQLVISLTEQGGLNRQVIAQSDYRVAGATSETVAAHAVLPPGFMVSAGQSLYCTANMMNVAAARGGEMIMRFVRFLV